MKGKRKFGIRRIDFFTYKVQSICCTGTHSHTLDTCAHIERERKGRYLRTRKAFVDNENWKTLHLKSSSMMENADKQNLSWLHKKEL
jgi:hypothetical protein